MNFILYYKLIAILILINLHFIFTLKSLKLSEEYYYSNIRNLHDNDTSLTPTIYPTNIHNDYYYNPTNNITYDTNITKSFTYSPTEIPSIKPTNANIIGKLTFESEIELSLSNPALNANQIAAITNTTCESMNLPSSDCTFISQSPRDLSTRRRLTTYDITAVVETIVEYTETQDANDLYTTLAASLTTAILPNTTDPTTSIFLEDLNEILVGEGEEPFTQDEIIGVIIEEAVIQVNDNYNNSTSIIVNSLIDNISNIYRCYPLSTDRCNFRSAIDACVYISSYNNECNIKLPNNENIQLNSTFDQLIIKYGSNINIQGNNSTITGELKSRFIYYSTSNITTSDNNSSFTSITINNLTINKFGSNLVNGGNMYIYGSCNLSLNNVNFSSNNGNIGGSLYIENNYNKVKSYLCNYLYLI
jgi:hypothetical protein